LKSGNPDETYDGHMTALSNQGVEYLLTKMRAVAWVTSSEFNFGMANIWQRGSGARLGSARKGGAEMQQERRAVGDSDCGGASIKFVKTGDSAENPG